jgi:hypothetical protein
MDITLSPSLGVKKLNRTFGQLSLASKAQFLRDRLKVIRQQGKASPEVLHQIESRLNNITQEYNPVAQWNAYELAYEAFIPIAPEEDLLGVFLDLRAKTDLLDPGNQEVWAPAKLQQVERELRLGQPNSILRLEIASLARAIHECGLRRKRDSEIRMCIVRRTLYLTALLSVAVLSLLFWTLVNAIPAGSPLQLLLAAGFGSIGALVTASLRLQRTHLVTNDIQADQASILFRAAFGAVLAVVVVSFLRLRIIDFPFLHIDFSPTAGLAPAALYVFGFLSGLAEEPLFRWLRARAIRPYVRTPVSEPQPQIDHRLPA